MADENKKVCIKAMDYTQHFKVKTGLVRISYIKAHVIILYEYLTGTNVHKKSLKTH